MIRRGVTLIELLVAIFVAGIVAYLAFDLIRGEHANYTKVRTKVRLQSDAREAIRVVEEDLLEIGFRTGVSRTTSSINANIVNCNLVGANRVVGFDGANSDTLVVQFFDIDPIKGVSCQDSPNRVRYYVNDADSTLVREFTKAASGTAKPTTTTSVLLQHVVTFQIQMGTDASVDPVPASSDLLWNRQDTCTTCWTISPALTQTKAFLPGRASDSGLEFGGWISGTSYSLTNNNTAALDANATYRASLYVNPNDNFRAMFDPAPGQSNLQLLLLSGAEILDSIDIRLPPLAVPTWIDWQFTTDSKHDYSRVSLQFRARVTKPATSTPPALQMSNLVVRRIRSVNLSSGAQLWENPDSTNAAQRRRTVSVRVWLLARSRPNKEAAQVSFSGIGNYQGSGGFTPSDKNSYVVYERIMPVENYGY